MSCARWCGENMSTIVADRSESPWVEGYTDIVESIADQLEDYIFLGLRETQVPRIKCKNCWHDMLDHTQADGESYDPASYAGDPCDIEINPGSIVKNYCGCSGFEPVEDLTTQST